MKSLALLPLLLFPWLVALFPNAALAHYTDGPSGPAVYDAQRGPVTSGKGGYLPTSTSRSYPSQDRYGVVTSGGNVADASTDTDEHHTVADLPVLAPDRCPMSYETERARQRSRLMRERDLGSIMETPYAITLVHKARHWLAPQEGSGPMRLRAIRRTALGAYEADIVLGDDFVCGGQALTVRVDDRPDPSMQVLWMNRDTVLFLTESGKLFTLSLGLAPAPVWRMVWDADLSVDFINPLKKMVNDLKKQADRTTRDLQSNVPARTKAGKKFKPPIMPKK